MTQQDGQASETVHAKISEDYSIRTNKKAPRLVAIVWLLIAGFVGVSVGDDGNNHLGAHLGKLNSYSHQVNGDVYTIDEHTFLIKNFFFDGLAQDAFFWAGSSIRPSNKGFIVPSEDGRTNRLQRYTNRDITIRLPDDRRITSIRWLAIWDIRGAKNLGDVIIPEGFEPPSPKKISEFSRLSHGVQSDTVTLLDSRSIGIQQLHYDGLGVDTFFYVGIGPQPNPSGTKVPDETGSLEPLGSYAGEDIVLELPGNLTIFDIDWLAIYDNVEQDNYGSVIIPSHLNVPPALVSIQKYESRLPQCEQLHRDIQLNWEVFGPQITFELVARINANDYIGFGLSGSDNSSQMIGADVSISYLEAHLGFTVDYNITDRHPCVSLQNNEFKGVCPDTKIGGVDNYQVHTYTRENGLTRITFRRNLINTGDEGDKVFRTTGSSYIVWAVGTLNKFKEPRYHYMYSKGNFKIEFGRKITKNCFQFSVPSQDPTLNANDAAFSRQQVAALTGPSAHSNEIKSPLGFLARVSSVSNSLASLNSANDGGQQQVSDSPLAPFQLALTPWGQPVVLNKSATIFYARLGHPGVRKGYMHITGEGSPGLVWYINGLMSPILHVQRGKTYTFRIEGGDSFDKSYRFYHPFYITDEPYGGYLLQNQSQRNQQKILAGLQFERLSQSGSPGPGAKVKASQTYNGGKPQPAQQPQMIGKPLAGSVGRLCAWLPNNINDIRKAETHQSFAQFRAKLDYSCAPGQQGIVQWTPNVSTPDVVYYQSYTQRNMGWKILVSDDNDDSNRSFFP